MGISTRLSIVRRAIEDAIARLADLPETAKTRELRMRAVAYERALERWERSPPTARQRETLVEVVLKLHEEIMRARAGRGSDESD